MSPRARAPQGRRLPARAVSCPTAGGDAATSSAWLHNMSVPSRSTLAVRREWLGGQCFDVCPRVGTERPSSPALASWVAEALRAHGASALLALLLEPLRPASSLEARVARALQRLDGSGDTQARADEALEEALRAAGVPPRVGVFVPRNEAPPRDATWLGLPACLAVLARRSGPLYLPGRRIDASLICPTDTLLVFPELT